MSKQKYEQEIEEILRKYEEEKARREGGGNTPATGGSEPRREPGPPRPPIDFRSARASKEKGRPSPWQPNKPQRGFTMPNWRRLSGAQYIGLAVGAAVLAVLLGRFVPLLAGMLVIASAILFFIPFVLYKQTGTSSGGYSTTEEKRWRGQPIDYSPKRNPNDGDDPLEGIKRWFRRR